MANLDIWFLWILTVSFAFCLDGLVTIYFILEPKKDEFDDSKVSWRVTVARYMILYAGKLINITLAKDDPAAWIGAGEALNDIHGRKVFWSVGQHPSPRILQ